LTLLFDESFPHYLPEALRLFGIAAEHTLDQLPPSTPDVEMFAFLRDKAWAWVTHEPDVKRKKHERAAILEAGVGAFVLTGSVKRSAIEMLRFVLDVLDEMQEHARRTPPPFIYGVSDRGKFERLR
jgi:hypothetical protein